MGRGSIVRSPDGNRWRVRRRWTDKPLSSLRRRIREYGEDGAAEGGIEALQAVDFLDSPSAALAFAAGALLLFVILLPLLGVALELIVLLVLLWSGLVSRIVFGRPWVVEAIDLDDAARSTAFAVKGWRRSGRAIEEMTTAITSAGPPRQIADGVPVGPPKPARS